MVALIGMSVASRELEATLFRAFVGCFVILTFRRALLPDLRNGERKSFVADERG